MKTLKEYGKWLLEELQNFEEPDLVKNTFSLEELRKQPTLDASESYIRETLGAPGGVGGFRTVWFIDETKIIKLAESEDVIRQNKNEWDNSECVGSQYAVKVFDYHHKFWWLIEERLELLGQSATIAHISEKLNHEGPQINTFSQLAFFFEESVKWIAWGDGGFTIQKIKMFNHLYSTNEWYKGLLDALKECQVNSRDFHDENWGLRPSTGELVLLDLGF